MRNLIVVCALFASACAPGVALPRESIANNPAALIFNGYTYQNVRCFECHNGDGRGARGPDLSHSVPKMSEDTIARVIRDGATGMPHHRERLSAQEIGLLAQWLQRLFPH